VRDGQVEDQAPAARCVLEVVADLHVAAAPLACAGRYAVLRAERECVRRCGTRAPALPLTTHAHWFHLSELCTCSCGRRESPSLQKHPTPFLPTPAAASLRLVRRLAHPEGACSGRNGRVTANAAPWPTERPSGRGAKTLAEMGGKGGVGDEGGCVFLRTRRAFFSRT